MSAVASLDAFLEKVAQRDGHQPEFLQAVREVFTSIWPFLEANRISLKDLLQLITDRSLNVQL